MRQPRAAGGDPLFARRRDGRDIAWTGNTSLLRNALQVVSSPVVADLRLAPTIATRGRTRAAVANEARRAVAAQLEITALAQALPVAGGFERDLPAALPGHVLPALTRVLRKHGIDLGGPPDLRASLASFGRDSLDAVPILLDAELELGIPLADHAFREFNAHSPLAALLLMLAATPAPRASA